MGAMFLSPAWIESARTALLGNSTLARAARSWTLGPVALVVEADPEHFTTPAAVLVEIQGGAVTNIRLVAADVERIPVAFGGSLARWKAVFAGQLDMVDGVIQGKLTFRGDLPTVARHGELFAALVTALGSIDTLWQDEAPAADAAVGSTA